MSARMISAADAATLLRNGGVIAYPTEAVWGLGCDPFDEAAVLRLLAAKQRAVDKGLILIAASISQLEDIVDWPSLSQTQREAALSTWPGPHTWVVPATARVPRWITGAHDEHVAVRVSAHPVVVALCEAFGGVVVSTSANRAGAPPPRDLAGFDTTLRDALDGIVEGETGGLSQPTPIRDARTGNVLRD